LVQNWTSQKETLKESIDRIGRHPQELSDGTSLFDTLFSTCFAQFERDNALAAVHVILLFSDGEDTASFGTDEKKAMDKCRENHVLIYAFNPKQALEPTSTGLSTLRQFADESGGRMFYLDGAEDDVTADISTMATDLRQGYLLFYRPAGMRQDGSFHKVVVVGPKRVASIVGTSGFYAPTR
jgi:VWFA-related protein